MTSQSNVTNEPIERVSAFALDRRASARDHMLDVKQRSATLWFRAGNSLQFVREKKREEAACKEECEESAAVEEAKYERYGPDSGVLQELRPEWRDRSPTEAAIWSFVKMLNQPVR